MPLEVNIVSEFIVPLDPQKRDEVLAKIESLESELNIYEKNSSEAGMLHLMITKYNALLNFIGN